MALTASAAWEHQFGDQQFTAKGAFAAGGESFNAKSLKTGRDAAVLGLSLESLHTVNNDDLLGLKAGIETRLMEGGRDMTFNIGLEYRF